jgi:TM2 domain-containing membrane protein YozV
MNAWQSLQPPFAGMQPSTPNPTAAAWLGLIPGVGAFYNGQFVKGFIHVVVFAVLCSIADHYDIFGLFIAAWIVYQSFEAYHTARALREGRPAPDPLGLNEVSNWLNLGGRGRYAGQPGVAQGGVNPGSNPPGAAAGSYQPPYAGQSQPPYQAPYQGAYQGPLAPPAAGFVDPAAPPVPPIPWRRREPVGAIVLIALGMLFLLGQLDIFHGRLMEFAWPLLLIALGVWLIVRRLGDSQGGSR